MYDWGEEVVDARLFCCGKEEGSMGCKRGKHVDKQTPGVLERMRAAYSKACERAERVRYLRCTGCNGDKKVASESEDEEAESETSKFLCQKCLDKQVFCYDCHRCFKAWTMKTGPLGERTICGSCIEKKTIPRRETISGVRDAMGIASSLCTWMTRSSLISTSRFVWVVKERTIFVAEYEFKLKLF